MNKGIEILLARMESNPDEFTTGNKSGKWQHLLEKYEEHMLPDERKVLMDKYNALKMEKFTEHVLKEIFEEPTVTYTEAMRLDANGTLGIGTSSPSFIWSTAQSQTTPALPVSGESVIQLGKQTLTEKTLKKIKALIK